MRRNRVTQLPQHVKAWLDRALAENAFSQYEALAKALKKKGFDISKSSLHRYGQQFEQRVQDIKTATDMARVIVEANPDDDNSQNEALIRLLQERLMGILVKLQGEDVDVAALVKMTRGVADLARASVGQKRFREEVQAKTQSAADKAAKIARRGGLTEQSVEAIRREILGIGT